LSVLRADGRPVAAHFGLRTERVPACWFPAYDPAFAKYSPGLILHLRMAEAAAADGTAYPDPGRGRVGRPRPGEAGDT
jgi:CelD/BcsL family acetyltransferase involved in cellulose biosynthesis